MIEARAAGKELPKAKKAPARSKVVNLMDVLAQSLEESKKRRSGAKRQTGRSEATEKDGRLRLAAEHVAQDCAGHAACESGLRALRHRLFAKIGKQRMRQVGQRERLQPHLAGSG